MGWGGGNGGMLGSDCDGVFCESIVIGKNETNGLWCNILCM